MVMRRAFASFLLLVVCGLIVTRAGFAQVHGKSNSWAGLERRPVHFPRLSPGSACPVSTTISGRWLSPAFGPYPALGHGPIYPFLVSSTHETAATGFQLWPKGRSAGKLPARPGWFET